ncbi:similar to Saccharomyces cerevisiae YOR119C RIO1 Essential serine kinase involved in cell cycle progression and processing of the 20S pre- rRNA into mature 18S rRNA [Maudiozyma barnettii]|uniref:Serine/threonine-protein kinase RIO1 n=1 Tax=Maudiozyma barnettii TaxID=61262 RepID=A0A8H2ZGQ1_9SACH|nr:protein kinase RIO1 [Kazachstania barnettii]CAB4253757.1 similar to Saccharomyces cerevisiae YOR119C RIO1 Essential serine kinase involved in cell cycle progression and processing of the 20S pre- rRNA into mature 18S rRNA [Kazachstania barnettii]CAD1781505.1 similar to Saccharomyces cerevisiae YOR119C RIO1 Essential serine kinase involved in cell cycle progression and processing of the 20S pre- rRNA into mature 18S rRNA [Kazachstania barnettii]
MTLEDKFDKLSMHDNREDREHVNTQILDKFSDKIKTDELSFSRGKTNKDKANRATVENVLDPRTMRFLQALMNRGIISDFNGCISTGKEANVYHAFAGSKQPNNHNELKNDDNSDVEKSNNSEEYPEKREEYAIKIYKTSILVFKDRERYVDGEFRFRNSRSQHNPRKMIKIWAEKEFRNLKRIYQAGVIPVPKPIEVKNNVLVMQFLNRGDGFASPRLRDYPYKDREEIYYYYYNMIADIRLLYQVCQLVHADLSEYNTLVHKDQLYVIDVSQSVQPEHPMSLDFLRMDIKNVNFYFEKMGIDIFSERLLFQFVISETLPNFQGDMRSLPDLMDYIKKNLIVKKTVEDEAEDEVFRSLYLVRNLNGLEERDFDRFTEGKFDLLKSLLAHDNEKNFSNSYDKNINEFDDDDGDDDGNSDDDLEEDSDEGTDEEEESGEDEYSDEEEKILKGKKYEDKDEKKQRKQEAKEAKREKRKTKVKKHIKKKLVKKTKSKK